MKKSNIADCIMDKKIHLTVIMKTIIVTALVECLCQWALMEWLAYAQLHATFHVSVTLIKFIKIVISVILCLSDALQISCVMVATVTMILVFVSPDILKLRDLEDNKFTHFVGIQIHGLTKLLDSYIDVYIGRKADVGELIDDRTSYRKILGALFLELLIATLSFTII